MFLILIGTHLKILRAPNFSTIFFSYCIYGIFAFSWCYFALLITTVTCEDETRCFSIHHFSFFDLPYDNIPSYFLFLPLFFFHSVTSLKMSSFHFPDVLHRVSPFNIPCVSKKLFPSVRPSPSFSVCPAHTPHGSAASPGGGSRPPPHHFPHSHHPALPSTSLPHQDHDRPHSPAIILWATFSHL